MRKNNFYFLDKLALIFLIGLIFAPLFNLHFKTQLIKICLVFFMAYFSFLFLNVRKEKTILFMLPLFVNTLLIAFVFKGENFTRKDIFWTILKVITSNFPLISLGLCFYFIERISTKIFGSYFTIFLALLSLMAYLAMTCKLAFENYYKYKDYFFYLFVFLSFSSINYKKSIKSYFYVLGLVLMALDFYLYYKKSIGFGFFFSPLLIFYFVFKGEKNTKKTNFEKYFIFAIIFIFPIVSLSMNYFLNMKPLALNLSSLIISFFVSVILFEAKIKVFTYLLLGIS